MDNFLAKFKLDKHHTIERFGVIVLSLIVITSLLLGFMGSRKMKLDSKNLSEKVIYTEKFTSSLTKTTGEVVGAYKNKSNKDFFLLIKFNDTTKVSTNAEDYQMFLTGSDVSGGTKTLKSSPAAMIYMFSSTGYMGVHMHSGDGFPEQIMKLTVRANNRLISPAERISENEIDSTFNDHDQFQLFFNPGGSDATFVTFLDDETIEIFDIYEQVVTRPQEKEIKDELTKQLKNMSYALNKIDEYERRVTEDGIKVPERPEEIKEDKIIAKKGTEELTRDRDMYKDSKGNKVDEKDIIFYFDSKKTVGGGFNFDWQNKTSKDGFFKEVTDKTNYVEFLVEKSKEETPSITTSDMKFFYKDGSEFNFDLSASARVGEQATINTDIQNLLSAWNEYYDLKKTYQREELKKLLLLELDANTASNGWTRNDSEKAFMIY